MTDAPAPLAVTQLARRGDYVVELAGRAEIAPFIAAHHYARGCSNTCTHAFAMRRASAPDQIVGGAMWLPPTRRCAESVDRASWQRVTSLSRLVLLDDEPRNAESLFVGAMLRHLERERRWVAAVTFADTSQGHRGTIYRATNWEDCGLTKLEPRWEDGHGRQVSRLSTKTRTDDAMRELGYRMVGRFAKHKFVYRFKRVASKASGVPPQAPQAPEAG